MTPSRSTSPSCTHLMREDIKDPRRLAAKADKIWQSTSNQKVNIVSAAFPPGQVPDEAELNALHLCPPSRPAPCPASYTFHSPALPSSPSSNLCWYYRNHGGGSCSSRFETSGGKV